MPDALRKAVERTFAATSEGAAETRDRAGGVLDQVARRGREARDTARESSTGAASRVIEAIEGMRLASREDVTSLSDKVDELSKRVSELEKKPKVEG